MRIEPLGDSALLVHVVEQFDAEESPDAVLRATQQLQAAKIAGLVELAPAYTTIGVFFDPAQTAYEAFRTQIDQVLHDSQSARLPGTGSIVEIPVCYEDEFAPDLRLVAFSARLSIEQVVQRHSSAIYRVICIGFTPGFPYLSGLPPELATPRLASPRKQVPTGAVAIGGTQTGIYPRKSPGGWNIIGRTPVSLFDVTREQPALLRAGDRIRFRRISRKEFDKWTS